MGFWQFATGGGSGGGSGDVVGPASSTDNAIARFDTGTGKLLQNSDVTVSDLAAGAVTITGGKGTALTIKNTNPDATTGASVAGDSITYQAGDAVASTDTNGAAAGGDVILTAGAAARRTSGDAQGGNIQLKVGAGIGSYPKGFISANGGNSGIRLVGDTSAGQPLSWFTVALWRGSLSNYGIILSSDSALYWTSGSTESETADTGLARSAAGVVKVTDGSTGLGKLILNQGASAAPSLSFGTDTNSGIYNRGADGYVMVAANGAEVAQFKNGNATTTPSLVIEYYLGFSYAVESAAPDAGILRGSAGVLTVTNGSSGLGKLLSGVLVEANTAGSGAPNALAATESGTVLTNEGATAKNYHTLPTAAAGYAFEFACQDADGIRITANTDDTIRVIDKVTAAAGYIESTTIGSVVRLVSINATEWFAMSIHGVWTDGTFTYDDTSLTTP